MKNNDLKVKPIKRYTTAKYPSYQDKNPLKYPETLPYPFRSKVLHGLLLTGLFTSMTVGTNPDPVRNIPKNTFSFAATGLPHTPASYGTGLPNKLDAKEARSFILKVFEKEGIPLQTDYLYKKNGQIYELDGYNEEKKIGFAWLNWKNLNADNFNRYYVLPRKENFGYFITYPRFETAEETQKKYEAKYETLKKTNQLEGDWYNKFRNETMTALIAESVEKETNRINISPFLKERAKAAFNLPKAQQVAAFEDVYMRYELEVLSKLNEQLKELAFYSEKNQNDLEEKILKKYHYVAKKIASFSFYWQLTEETKQEIDRYIKTFKNNGDINTLEKQLLSINEEKLSLEEVKYMEKQAIKNKEFIAPISSFNSNFQYHYWGKSEWSLDEKTRKQIEETTNKIADDKERKIAYRVAIDEAVEKLPDPKEEVLVLLEKQVKEYIRWAKSQGMY